MNIKNHLGAILLELQPLTNQWYKFEYFVIITCGIPAVTAHTIFGILISVTMYLLTGNPVLAIGLPLVVGILKEFIDYLTTKGGVSVLSAAMTGIGGLVGLIMFIFHCPSIFKL